MKTIVLLALAACQAVALPTVAKKPPAAKAKSPKIHVDASEATAQLQELMAQASGSLASAERHHERQVQKARKAIEASLDSESKVLGGAVKAYEAELEKSATDLENLVTVSKAAVKEDEARNSGNWGNDPGMESRARLGAQADMAAREVRKAKRMHDRAIHSAELLAEAPLEDTTMHLSRKVGDLSDVVQSAKSLLETAANKIDIDMDDDDVKPTGNASNATNATSNKTANSTKRLEELVVSVKSAMAKHKADLADAEKRLNQVVSNSSKALAAGMAKIEDNLGKQEQKEIKKVREGAKMPPIGSKKAPKKLRTPKAASGNKTKDDAAMKSLVELLKKAFKGAKKSK